MTYYFKDYLKVLSEKGELKTISRFVDPNLEIAEITDREASAPNGGKALLFNNTGTDFPIITNLFTSEKRIALSFEMKSMEEVSTKIVDFYDTLTHNQAISRHSRKSLFNEVSQFFPRTSDVGSCQEVAIFPPDLNRIPFLKNRTFDEAYSLHEVPMVIKNPISAQYAVSSTRLLWHSRSTFQVSFEPSSLAGHSFHNSPMRRVPVAFFLGGDPLYCLSGLIPRSGEMEPFLLGGYIRKKAVVKVPCLSQPIEVPENCDLVIEGYIDKNAQLVPAAACGNNTGFYSVGGEEPLVHVTCITHRKNAHIPVLIPSIGLHTTRGFLTKALSTMVEAGIENSVDRQVKKLCFPHFCKQGTVAIVGINKFYPGQVEKTAHAFWGSDQAALNKLLIVVDSNTDVHNPLKVNDCISKYYNPNTDTFLSQGPLSVTDHAAMQRGFGGKLCLDATCKNNISEATIPVAGKAFEFYHKSQASPSPEQTQARILIAVDDQVNLDDLFLCLWLAVSNTDPLRDIHIRDGILYVDASIKTGSTKEGTRPWPNICCSSMKVIQVVDNYWERLKIGDFIPSPSRVLHPLLRDGNAQISE
jgi:4-hydroxy-3-polyprenylbenzoate decarboxylase